MSFRMPRKGPPRRFSIPSLILSVLILFAAVPACGAAAFTATTLGDYDNVTVMQVSGSYDVGYLNGSPDMSARRTIAREFYRTHGDDYDMLVIFTNFDFVMPPGAKAFFSAAKNDVRGIGVQLAGQELFDYTNAYSYTGAYLNRLQGTIDMANITSHVLEPTDPEFDDTLSILTHEFLHRWGAYLHFMDGAVESDALLGLDDAHWSYLFDSGGSTLYGNRWHDNGDGTFTAIAPEQARRGEVLGRIFSPLELYLMGLIDKTQVPSMTLIDSPGIEKARLPEIGATIPGMARTITIDDIVAAEGERSPSAADSRKEFRVAFIYAVTPGTWSVSNAHDCGEVAAINRLQTEWEKRFSILTDGVAMMRTAFVAAETVETNPGVTTPTGTPAVTPSVNSGVAWLVSREQPGGYWQDQPGTDRRDTAATVSALKPFPAASSAVASGQAWLGAVAAENNDFAARRLLGLESASGAELAAQQNADGGWGSAAGYASNPIDTALVMQALAARGGEAVVVAAAVNYLYGKQNPDGGWSAGYGGSQVQPTARALLALNSHRGGFPLEPAIADGLAWLAAKQNGDGGFGNSQGSVVDTAVALQAIKAAGAAPAAAGSAVNYLLARQDTAGSWNGSIFQTAQAVEALYAGQVAPDLVVTTADIGFSPAVVSSVPSTVTVTVTVRNQGGNPAAAVNVALYESDPAQGNLLGEQTVSVPGSGSTAVTFSVTVASTGLHEYCIVVDGHQQVAEAAEWNNTASKRLAANLAPPTIGFAQAASAGSEAVTAVPLAVALSYPWPAPVTVNYSVNVASTATASADYVLASGALTFAADETSKTINLTVVNDERAETDKTVIVDLSAPTFGILGPARHSYTIRDDEAPAVTIVSPPAGLVGQSAPQLLYATTGGSVVVKVDGSVVAAVSGDTLATLGDGAHSVEVSASNSFGLATTARVDFVVDTTAPTVIIHAPVGVQTTGTPRLDYLVEGAATVEVRLDGSLLDKVSGQILDPLAEGSHTLTVTATNAAGRSNAASSTFVIDTLPPAVTLHYPYEGGVLEEADPQLLYTLGEAGTVTVRVDGAIVSGKSGERLAPLGDGEHTVAVTLTDANGISATASAVFVVELDAEAPLVADPLWTPPSAALWSRSDVAVGRDGTIFLAGLTTGYDLFIARYDKQGAKLWSFVPIVGNLEGNASAMGIDDAGNMYVAFTSIGGVGGYAARAGRDVYLAKFDNRGTRTGLIQIASGYDDYVYDMVVTGNGTVYIAGTTGGNLFPGSGGGYSTWVASYDTNLTNIWGGQRTHASYYDPGNCFIALGPDGTVHVAGRIQGRFANTGTQIGLYDYYIARWSSAGSYLDVQQGGTSQNEEVYGLGTDAFGNVYLLGSTQGTFAGYANLGLSDYFLVKCAPGNRFQWVHQWGGASNDWPADLMVEPDGDLLVAEQRNLTRFDRDKNLIWTSQMLTINGFGSGGGALDGEGNLFAVYEGSIDSSVLKYRDPRRPAITVEAAPLTSQSTLMVRGEREVGAEVFLSTDAGASCDGLRYPSATTWDCTLSGLVEGLNQLEAVARSTEGFRSDSRAVIVRDSIPPHIVIDAPVEGETCDEKPVIAYRVDDEHPGEVTAYLNGVRLAVLRYPLEGLLPGTNALTIVATDRAGNRGEATVTFLAAGAAVGESPWSETLLEQFGSAGADVVDQVVRGRDGNIYMTGTVYGDLDGQANHGLGDAFVRKYDADGHLVWTRLVGTEHAESGKGLAVDAEGNIALLYQVDFTSVKGNSSNWSEVVVARYDTDFNLVWSDRIGSTARDYAVGLVLDSTGNVYVAGNTEGSVERRTFGGPSDYFLAGYDRLGVRLWLHQSSVAGEERLYDLALNEASGFLYLVGSDKDGEPFWQEWSVTGTWGGGQHAVRHGRGAIPGAIAVDGEGKVYIAGRLEAVDGLQTDVFVDGPGWAYEFGAGGNDAGAGLILDDSGHVYVVGTIDGQLPDAAATPDDQEIMVAKLVKNGALKWLTRFGTDGSDAGTGAVMNRSGDLLIAGTTTGALMRANTGGTDIFLAAMSSVHGPFLAIDPPASPTRSSNQLLTGRAAPAAAVTISVALPAGSPATLSQVVRHPDGTWECTVDNLAANADNVFAVTAADQSGAVTRTVTIVTDTLSPALTVSPTTSPTDANAQSISGTIEDDATLTVTAGSPAATTAVAVTAGAWRHDAELQPGENLLRFTATDRAGNATVRSVIIDYQPPQLANTIAITKAVYDARKKVLNVEATSAYRDAALQVVGYGPMTFARLFKGKYCWTFSLALAARPESVTVSGPEGAVTTAVR